MSDENPLQAFVDQAKRVAEHHPELAASYIAAIKEKARGLKPEELDRLLGKLPKIAEGTLQKAKK
jgi:hypothetical protein